MKRQENFALFRLEDFRNQPDADDCYIVFISGKTKSLVLSCLRYATFLQTRWYVSDEKQVGQFTDLERDEIESLVDEAKEQIIMGCSAEDLIKTQRMLIAAITGTQVDLSSDLPTGVVDFTNDGLASTLRGDSGNIAQAVEALNLALDNIRAAVESGDLEDDLANVWNVLTAIATAMGGSVSAPPAPL